MKFHKDGTLPENGEYFVFGSNAAGRHGRGAAKVALERFGAVYGIGYGGIQGQSVAIPTKNSDLVTLPLDIIEIFVKVFVDLTHKHPDKKWFVTRVGCGLAGLNDKDIAPMFKGAINCSFPEPWREYLE